MSDHRIHRRLPAECFYWALLDTSGLGTRPSREQLGYCLEGFLPCPVENVQAVFAKAGEQSFVACAIDRSRLEAECEDALTLGPAELPAFLMGSAIKPEGLNLLVGEFEPRPVRRLRNALLLQAAAIIAALTVLVTIALEIRTAELEGRKNTLDLARMEVYRQVLPDAGSSKVPTEIQMTAELRQLRQTRSTPLPLQDSTDECDVVLTLARLLNCWPAEEDAVQLQTEHVSITPAAINLRGTLPSSSHAEQLTSRLTNLDGWRLQQPQLTTTRENVQAVLRFLPHEEPLR